MTSVNFTAVRKPVPRVRSKPFEAKFKGLCPRCNDVITPGQMIRAREITNPWIHDTCKPAMSTAHESDIKEWEANIAVSGFVRGSLLVWEYGEEPHMFMAWCRPEGDGGVMFCCISPIGYFESRRWDVHLRLIDAVKVFDGDSSTAFDEYRQKLVERYR